MQMSAAGRTAFKATNFIGQADGIASDVIFVGSTLVGLVLWGFGLWWLVHGIYSVTARRIQGHLSFNMGFWGFIFPLGVFTTATIALHNAIPSQFLAT